MTHEKSDAAPIPSRELQILYEYWVSKLRGRRMPARSDIDPVELPPTVLPHLMILDLHRDAQGLTMRFRLTGTHIDDALGGNPTGQPVSESLFSNAQYVAYIKELYTELVDTGRPIYSENLFRLAGQSVPMLTKRLSLPLSSNGKDVDMTLVGAVFEYPKPIQARYTQTLDHFSETTRCFLRD